MAVSPPLLTLIDVCLAHGHYPLLQDVNFSIQQGERIGLIGRNGVGKSSLLHVLNGETQPDAGKIVRAGACEIAFVEQEPQLDPASTPFELIINEESLAEDWQRPARARMLLKQLHLTAEAPIHTLSGGMRKRVALARALTHPADLLLLDEPTNHLDFDSIAWLEQHLKSWKGSLVVITHDRYFLDQVATRIVELDRGQLLSFPGNFSQWHARKNAWLAAQQLEHARFDKVLAQEEAWIRQGIEARRTRNEGRVRRLEQLRQERTQRREQVGQVKLSVATGQRSGKLVATLKEVSQSFGNQTVVCNYSTTIQRGDRVGIIGANGTGKTTLLRIILGELKPDQGEVQRGTHLSVAYFDQMRAQLKETETLAEVISPGSEWVEIAGTRKHIMRYLSDFLFSPARAHSPVSSLSGGERARLLLARLFARPANILVLDEPTNDLDIETLELLESLLQEYSGTVLLVSHDRAFLNNVVTQVIANDGPGIWNNYVGGYDDWLAQRPSSSSDATVSPNASQTRHADKPASTPAASQTPKTAKAKKPSRLSTWELRELETLPNTITALEAQQTALSEQLSEGALYRDTPEEVTRIQRALTEIEKELAVQFARWESLEMRQAAQNVPAETKRPTE